MAQPSRRPDGTATAGRLAATGPGRFEVSGDIGFEDAARLLAEGDAAFGALKQAEVDFSGVARVDSAGLALLLEWSLAARSAGHALRYRNVPSAIASLAGISDVAELLAPVPGG